MDNKALDSVSEEVMQSFPGFVLYLKQQWYTDTHFSTKLLSTYSIFWWITPYIEEKIRLNQIEEIRHMLSYIDQLYDRNNKSVDTLIATWFLENFDTIKSVLPKILPILPQRLHDILMLHYSSYIIESKNS